MINETHLPFSVRCQWQDRIIKGTEEIVTPWDSNQFQHQFPTFLAVLLKGACRSAFGDDPVGKSGLYLAVGVGEESWDTVAPTLDPVETVLRNEVYRKPIDPTKITFLNPLDDTPVTTPTRKIEFTLGLSAYEARAPLREWGIFGSRDEDISASNTGFMLDWKYHATIDKTDGDVTIFRTIRFELGLPT